MDSDHRFELLFVGQLLRNQLLKDLNGLLGNIFGEATEAMDLAAEIGEAGNRTVIIIGDKTPMHLAGL